MWDSEPVTAEDRKWRAESDARTLADAQRIKEDLPRLESAQEAAKRMADEEAEKAKAMRKIAGKKGREVKDPANPPDNLKREEVKRAVNTHRESKKVVQRSPKKKPRTKKANFNVFQRLQ